MSDLHFFDSQQGKKIPFQPLDPNRITLYVCGPTVYNHVHIGNARPMVVFDVLYRLLQRHYPTVLYARNITDVDDKINQAASDQDCSIQTISERFTRSFRENMQALKVLPPTIEPLATQHIQDIIQCISKLIADGHAYEAEGHVLFDVSQFEGYGKLSHRNLEDMIAGARVEVAPYKRNPADFVLFKPSNTNLPGWESPWGRGRPGWHIECTAMIRAHLGEQIDIHGGGADLIFPHHENERAQGCCLTQGSSYANYWMHNGFITINSEKMSKSTGNFLTIKDLLEKHPGEVLRYALLGAYYRSPLDWTNNTTAQAKASLDRLYNALRQPSTQTENTKDAQIKACLNPVENALNDDLNTPLALSALHQITNEIFKSQSKSHRHSLQQALKLGASWLGLLNEDPEAWFTQRENTLLDADAIEAAIASRKCARAEKRFADADRIRDELKNQGIELEDSSEGTRWHRC